MTTTGCVSLCESCTHRSDTAGLDNGMLTGSCEAFPAGIPLAIWANGGDHRRPIRGDNGIVYKMAPDGAELRALWTVPTKGTG